MSLEVKIKSHELLSEGESLNGQIKAEKAIPSAPLSDLTREQFETELTRLNHIVGKLLDQPGGLNQVSGNPAQVPSAPEQASTGFDQVSGLATRDRFFEMADGEFKRAKRYDRDLSLVTATIGSFAEVQQERGLRAADFLATSIAQVCVSSSRVGIDILGRVDEDRIAMLLPETGQDGSLRFLSRMQEILKSTPIVFEINRIDPKVQVVARTLKEENTSFDELFARV